MTELIEVTPAPAADPAPTVVEDPALPSRPTGAAPDRATPGWTGAPAPPASARGRDALAAWLDAQPADLFADDADLAVLLSPHDLGRRIPALHAAGRAVAGPLDVAARENDLIGNHPTLENWDGIGRYVARVAHHPSYREAGRLIYGTGVMAAFAEAGVDGLASDGLAKRPVRPAPHRFILSLFYLTAQAGEAGHNCPLACDAGAIRTLQHLGTAEQQARFLPRLLDPSYDTNFSASQFLTEVQGGSDVGANAVVATPVGAVAPSGGAVSTGSTGAGTSGTSTPSVELVQTPAQALDHGPGSAWSISGEKWFCSNADADVFLVTARVADPETGTKGLGLFLIPRTLPDGSVNGFRIRRLKSKLGTRSMASGEIDFDQAQATALGAVRDGFRNVVELVLTASRLFNAAGCAAHSRRAWVVASTYAQHRAAFGRPIGEFPLVAETLAWMRADATASLAGTLLLAQLQEQVDAGTVSEADAALFRIGVTLNKLQTSVLAHETVNRGIEVLGGNGAIESFSILPRLLRDNVVYENWEGSHNVLRAQVLRDCARLGLLEGFFDALTARLPQDADALADDRRALAELLRADEATRDLRFRRLAARMATWVMLAGLAVAPELSPAAHLTRRHLAELPIDEEYLATVRTLQR